VVELGGKPDEIADPIAIAVGERFDMQLIENGVLVPERICGWGGSHELASTG
jgi:hypothetical protein